MPPANHDPEPSPLLRAEQVVLRDGVIATIRPIRPGDAPLLQAGYRALSRDTMYLRFHAFARELPAAEAQRLADVDYRTRMAFVATVETRRGERIAGVARYEISPSAEAPLSAYCGVVVGDRLQRQGLGAALLRHLGAYARDQGIQTFVGAILNGNAPMLRFVERSGLKYRLVHAASGVSEVYVELAARPEP